MKKDPYRRMQIREEAVTADGDGIIYYFCPEGCRDKFLREKFCARMAFDLMIIGGGSGSRRKKVPPEKDFLRGHFPSFLFLSLPSNYVNITLLSKLSHLCDKADRYAQHQ